MTTRYDYKLAAGYNNAAGLTNLETITVSGDSRPFFSPVGYSNYRAGVRKIRSDGTVIFTGFPSAHWIIPAMTRKQWEYLSDQYCSGGFSGKVTVRTRVGRTSYSNFNAILVLPDPETLQRRFIAFEDVRLEFTRMIQL